jgi:hypothetical protein
MHKPFIAGLFDGHWNDMCVSIIFTFPLVLINLSVAMQFAMLRSVWVLHTL